MEDFRKLVNEPYRYPKGAENSTPADGANSKPAVAKTNWFNRLMCFFGIHDDYFQASKLKINVRIKCRNCNRAIYYE